MHDFWRFLNGIQCFKMTIIGYSLPEHDNYAKQIMYNLIDHYQTDEWGQEVFGNVKKPLLIIDKLPDNDRKETFLNNYRFVNWDRAILERGGFNEGCLDKIFNEI